MSERALGRIVALQVQRDPLKEKGRGYDPGPILQVQEASLSAQGMVGLCGESWVVDAHHSSHPRARGGGNRALSIGFTEHYERIRERFGKGDLGCGGENVIVDSDARVNVEDLAGTVVVRTTHGDVELTGARVAAPCAEFTSYLLDLDVVSPIKEIAADIAFLEEGTRGFILGVAHLERPVQIHVGAEVVVR